MGSGRGLTPNIRMLCFVKVNSILFNPLDLVPEEVLYVTLQCHHLNVSCVVKIAVMGAIFMFG